MATKRIPISNVRLGMYVSGFDRAWLDTPFFRHKFLLKTSTQLQKLKKSGVQEIEIDTSKGLDILREDAPLQNDGTLNPLPETPSAEEKIANLSEELEGISLSDELHEVQATREHMLEEAKEILNSVRTSGVINGTQVKTLSQEILTHTLGHEEVFASLIHTREFLPDLYEHMLAVGTLSVLMGRLLNYNDDDLANLAMGALLHDVGCVTLPPECNRPHHRLSSIERAQFNLHTTHGVDLLKKIPGIPIEVLTMVAEHHNPHVPDFGTQGETFVPHGLSTSIHLIQIVDRYDELLSGQSTVQPLSVKEALGQLYQLGQQGQLNLPLVTHLISQIGIYPLYSLVKLNTGERGIVTTLNPGHLLQPIVLVFQDSQGQPYAEPIPLNFASTTSEHGPISIVKVLDPQEHGVNVEAVLADWITY